jgi:hypothetical protein
MIPISRERYDFLRAIVLQYRQLSSAQIEKWRKSGIDVDQDAGSLPLTRLVNPVIMRTLKLERPGAMANLLIHFDIAYDEWGHAHPQLSLEATDFDERTLPAEQRKFLQDLPKNFLSLCAYREARISVKTLLLATIDNFFNIS